MANEKILLTKGYSAIVDDEDFEMLSRYIGGNQMANVSNYDFGSLISLNPDLLPKIAPHKYQQYLFWLKTERGRIEVYLDWLNLFHLKRAVF